MAGVGGSRHGRRPPASRIALAGLLLLFAGLAGAQPIYRCGPEGRSYSQVPCAEGAMLEVDDRRTPQQQGAAEAQRARLVRDAQALPQRPPEAPRGAAIVHTRRPPPEPVSVNGPQTYKVRSGSPDRAGTKKARAGRSPSSEERASSRRGRGRDNP